MSAIKHRLHQLAEQVKDAGLAGKSMQTKMSEIIAQHDLTAHEIDRISEIANRDVQLALYKTATDKRFKFELVDPAPLKAAAKKQAEQSLVTFQTQAQKTASVVAEIEGDPFAVPYRETPLSLYEQPMNPKTAALIKATDLRNTALALDQKLAEYKLVLDSGRAQMMKIAGEAEKTYDKSVQAAMDMIMGGITLPSLYTAVAQAVGGNGATDEERKGSDYLMLLVIKGLKERGFPNHRLGFRHRGNIELLDSLSSEDLLTLCKRSTGRIHEHDIPIPLMKVAEYLKRTHEEDLDPVLADSGRVAQPYLDEKYVDNLPGGKPLIINGENEFVIGIVDLIGDQGRMRRCHAANEYIGLKLKQIEATLRGLRAAQKTAEMESEVIMTPGGPVTIPVDPVTPEVPESIPSDTVPPMASDSMASDVPLDVPPEASQPGFLRRTADAIGHPMVGNVVGGGILASAAIPQILSLMHKMGAGLVPPVIKSPVPPVVAPPVVAPSVATPKTGIDWNSPKTQLLGNAVLTAGQVAGPPLIQKMMERSEAKKQRLQQSQQPQQQMRLASYNLGERLKSSNAKIEMDEAFKIAIAPLLGAAAQMVLPTVIGMAANKVMAPSTPVAQPAVPKPPAVPKLV